LGLLDNNFNYKLLTSAVDILSEKVSKGSENNKDAGAIL
jgi:hypothetical protein